jgi:type III pantothenate kinase
MPGVLVGSEALFKRAAKLPHVQEIDLVAPKKAIGGNTVESLRSGIVLGYAAAIDGLVRRMSAELGSACEVVSTGGLGSMFQGTCETIQYFEPNLTLDGLVVAAKRLEVYRPEI